MGGSGRLGVNVATLRARGYWIRHVEMEREMGGGDLSLTLRVSLLFVVPQG